VDNHSSNEEQSLLSDYCNKNYSFILSYSNEELEKVDFFENEKNLCEYKSSDRIIIINNHDNLGFAKGNNVALRYILKIGGKYALLLNNDTIVEKNAVKLMYDFIRNNFQCTAVIPQIRYLHSPDKIWNCGGKLMLGIAKKYYYADMNIANVPQIGTMNVGFVTGCALLIDLKRTGILSEFCFFGEEDFELSLRLKKLHQEKICLFNAVIYHNVGASEKKLFERTIGLCSAIIAVRLVNLKSYKNKIYWWVIVFVSFFYSIYFLRKTYKSSPWQLYRFWNFTMHLVKYTRVFSLQVWNDCMKKTF
jgi:GT2 family glycosyltransferase